jgi:riboflavin biosynthesis pyrimidine reductase
VHEDALEEVRRLKSGEGSELEVSGPGLAAAWIQAALVDEIGVYISPIAVGDGKHFFATLERPLELRFPGLQTFEGGVVHLRYAMQAQPRALGRARLI